MRVALRRRSGWLVFCLCLSLVTLLLQSIWVPIETTQNESAGKSPKEHGGQSPSLDKVMRRLETLGAQVQKLNGEKEEIQPNKKAIAFLLRSFKQDQKGLARLVEMEMQRVSQRLDQLSNHLYHDHKAHMKIPHLGSKEKCEDPKDPAYPVCAEKMEFLRAHWQSDPCYIFYRVDGTSCSILSYLSQIEGFCPPAAGGNLSELPWHQKPHTNIRKAYIRDTLSSLYDVISNSSSLVVKFIHSRLDRMSEKWIRAGLKMRNSSITASAEMKILLYPGALAGKTGEYFESKVDKGGPLGELVQWADLSACLTVLGHNLIFSTSQEQLHRLIGAPPGKGSCPIRKPLPFDLIYTDYHGLAHLQGAMGLAFNYYKILDSFGTEPAFNLASYAQRHGFKTLWGSWNLHPLQYMNMFPHTPDNSFLGFVSEEEAAKDVRDVPQPHSHKKKPIAVVYGKQDYMWKGKADYVQIISEELETHATVYGSPEHPVNLPSFVINNGLLSQEDFLHLLRSAKLFVGLGFPYEGPAPIEAIALGCIFLQPSFDPPHTSDNNDFYKGKPTTRQISSQHPYAEQFIGKPYVWTVDMTNATDVREAVRGILKTEVKPFTPREFTFVGMLERVHGYITQQTFCSESVPTRPPEGALKLHLGPLGQSCVSVCQRSSLSCEPALFHHLNTPAAFTRLGLACSRLVHEENHLFPSYNPWGRHCGLQREALLFSCAGSDPSHRRLCPCSAGQVAQCPGCL